MSTTVTPEELNLLIKQTYKVENDFNELKASYDYLQDTVKKVVEFLPNAIWVLNSDKTVFLQNSKARGLWELLGLLELQEEDYEVNFKSRDYLVKSSVYQDKVMFSVIDITEQKRKENLATMGQMAAHLSHEIKNPIGSISLLSSALKKRVLEENIPIVEEIQSSVYRIDRIINATLMFSKGVQTNKSTFKWDDLKKSIHAAIAYYGYSKEIKYIFPQDNFTLYADKDLLEMLFSNFISNAIDAIELDDNESGKVEVIYKNDAMFHKFYIYDTGIPIEDESGLFQAFNSTKANGNGLGLVLSRQIAEAHGGYARLMAGEKKAFEVAFGI